jgi:hypothetical protein
MQDLLDKLLHGGLVNSSGTVNAKRIGLYDYTSVCGENFRTYNKNRSINLS